MKKILLFLVVLVPFLSMGQKKSFVIDWTEPRELITSDSKTKIPAFKNNFSFTFEKGLTFFEQWTVSGAINERSVSLTNVVYEPLSSSDLYDLKIASLPSVPKYQVRNSYGRGQAFAVLEISPIINDNGAIKRIRSFDVNYTTGARKSQRASQVITNSVLRSGEWYRFNVDKTGVFRLTRNFLNSLGVDTNTNPRNIKIFGQGGRMLPLPNDSDYPFDLTENAIRFVGEEDGIFNSNDYILFYAEGPTEYSEDSNTNINAYSDVSYYYVNVSPGSGKRITPMIEPTEDANEFIDTFHDYQYHEMDEYSPARVGRRWFGDRMDFENEKTFEFEFPNLITTEPVALKVYTAATADVQTSMELSVNGNLIDTFNFAPIEDPILGGEDSFIGDIDVASPTINVTLNYNDGGNPSSVGYLDYVSIEALRALVHEGDQFVMRNNDVATLTGVGQYSISNASNVSEVWDVTDRYNVTAKENENADALFSFKANLGEVRRYVVVDPSDYYSPQRAARTQIANQDIKGTIFNNSQGQFQDIDYLIITRADMLSQAERLAQINRDQNNLNVKVLLLEDIYTEFSSGNPDIAAIRNLVKYVYDNASSEANRLKYLCLFGDGSFDYKDRINGNTNVVPSWHSYSSFSLSGSFVSDDFFGMMDMNEGAMQTSDKLDIAVGRIIADTPQRAKDLVDKIESYYSEESFGPWRNNIMLIADDIDEAWEEILQGTSNDIADEIVQNKPFLNAQKVFSDSYTQQVTPGGERYPDVNQEIFDAIEVGALVVNYFGHGGEDGIARERIFDRINAQEVQNTCRLNCFVTVTCEYTKFDNPLRLTAGEQLAWNTRGGAVSLITTTRQIFVSVGVAVNVLLEQYLFGFGTNDYVSMAEALRLTKNEPAISGIEQRRLVFFIGDPAMKLAFPRPNIRLTEINDVPVADGTEVLQALSLAKIEGEVTDEFGNLLSNYNGTLTATIYDKDIERTTLGNDGVSDGSGNLITLDYNSQGEIIFRGQASVVNGAFEFDFVVPRDIGIPVGNGKVSFYAKAEGLPDDKAGANFDIQIGGINENADTDNEGPVVNLFMNDENFVTGGITNESPSIFAKLYDDNGINTASGIGHDIIAIIDGDETNPFKLNDYYITEVDDHQRGSVNYPLRDLEPGLHTLTLKAWDVYNNSTTSEIQFVVHDEDEVLVIKNVLNYPNPFINYTEFWFNHNSSEVLDVSVQIFTVSGKLVRTLNGQTNANDKCCGASALSKDIVWDGRDDFGDKVGKGVYVYKLKVRSPQLNKQVEKIEKLVILQ